MHFALSNGEQKWCTVGGVGTLHSVAFFYKESWESSVKIPIPECFFENLKSQAL